MIWSKANVEVDTTDEDLWQFVSVCLTAYRRLALFKQHRSLLMPCFANMFFYTCNDPIRWSDWTEFHRNRYFQNFVAAVPVCVDCILSICRLIIMAEGADSSLVRFSSHLFEHLKRMSLAFYLKHRTGEVIRIMDRGSSSVESIVNTVLFILAPTIFYAASVTLIFFKLGTQLIVVIIFATVVIYFISTFLFTNWRCVN